MSLARRPVKGAHKKVMGSCHQYKGGIYAKKGKSLSVSREERKEVHEFISE